MDVSFLLLTILGVIALNGATENKYMLEHNPAVDAPISNEWQRMAVETHPRRERSGNELKVMGVRRHPRQKRSEQSNKIRESQFVWKCDVFDELWNSGKVTEYKFMAGSFCSDYGTFRDTRPYNFKCQADALPTVRFYHENTEYVVDMSKGDQDLSNRNAINDIANLINELNQRGGQSYLIWIVHGFWSGSHKPWMRELKDSFTDRYERLSKPRRDVIVAMVDWNVGAKQLNDWDFPGGSWNKLARDTICNTAEWVGYGTAASTTWPVGLHLNLLYRRIRHAIPTSRITPTQTICVGHSLGAHVCGFMGKSMIYDKGKLDRIIGLDPAGPIFDWNHNSERLHNNMATIVEVIHTNSHRFGSVEPLGTRDIYVNGGGLQPICGNIPVKRSICSHSYAYNMLIHLNRKQRTCRANYECFTKDHEKMENINWENPSLLNSGECHRLRDPDHIPHVGRLDREYDAQEGTYWVMANEDSDPCKVDVEGYQKYSKGVDCNANNVIDSEDKCKLAANALGLKYEGKGTFRSRPAGCYWAEYSSSTFVFYNDATTVSTNAAYTEDRGGICLSQV